MTLTYDLRPSSFHDVTVTADEGVKNVHLKIYSAKGEHITTISMSPLAAERLWHALKNCVDYAMKAYD